MSFVFVRSVCIRYVSIRILSVYFHVWASEDVMLIYQVDNWIDIKRRDYFAYFTDLIFIV